MGAKTVKIQRNQDLILVSQSLNTCAINNMVLAFLTDSDYSIGLGLKTVSKQSNTLNKCLLNCLDLQEDFRIAANMETNKPS